MTTTLSRFSTALLLCVSLFLAGLQNVEAAPSKPVEIQSPAAPASAAFLTKELRSLYYYIGVQFSIMAIMAFKQHKDNPTQVPIGVPQMLVAVAAFFFFAGNWTVPARLNRISEKLS